MKLNILLVDADPEVSEYIALRIRHESSKFSIAIVDGGIECLEYLRINRVDCILSDYQMPGMTGMELLHTLRACGNDTPFIFITAQGSEEVAREAFKNGAHDYFTKDRGFAHFARITNSIEQAVKQHRAEKSKLKAEAALLKERNTFNSILDCIEDVISIHDKYFRIVYQNAATKKAFGEHTGELCYKAYQGRDSICDDCQLARSYMDGEVHRLRKRIPVDGRDLVFEVVSYPMLDKSGELTGGIELAIDVTKTCEAEEALAEGERLLESVFASIRDEITVLDMDQNILRHNPTIAHNYAHAMPVVGRKCYEAFQGRTSVCPGCPSERALKTGETARAEVAAKDALGNIRGWVDIHSFPLVDSATGRIKGVIEHVRDVTDRKMLENRTADFYAMLTHDLSSPLMALMGYSDLMKSNSACIADDEALQLAAGVRDSGVKLKKLMDEYLEMSKIEFGKFSLCQVVQDFRDVLADVKREFELSAKARELDLGFDVQDDLPMAYMDRKYLQRAVSNLLQNAVKYTPRGGKVLGKAWSAGGEGGGPIVLEVSDNGPGIPEDEAGRIFEKYYRSPKVMGSKGTGLGLYIVKTVAEAHGGKVEVHSEPGTGSTFRLFIPVKA